MRECKFPIYTVKEEHVHVEIVAHLEGIEEKLFSVTFPIWEQTVQIGESCFQVICKRTDNTKHTIELQVSLVSTDPVQCAWGIRISIAGMDAGYTMIPAALYDGPSYIVCSVPYPPMFPPEDPMWKNEKCIINDVPLLDRSTEHSLLELRDGDMASRWIVLHKACDDSLWCITTEDVSCDGSRGFSLSYGKNRELICTRWVPMVRSRMYRNFHMVQGSDDTPLFMQKGEVLTTALSWYTKKGYGPKEALSYWFELLWTTCPHDSSVPSTLPFSAMFSLIEQLFNATQWNDTYGYYRVAPEGEGGLYGDWQAGWVGGGMTHLPLYARGNALSKTRAMQTMDTLCSTLQHPSGFIYSIMYNGVFYGDNFLKKDYTNWTLIRKNGDVLLYVGRYLMWLLAHDEKIEPSWMDMLSRLAQACVRIWEHHGEFGQFIDSEKASIVVKGTCAGSTIPGGLAIASFLLHSPYLLEIAQRSIQHYYNHFIIAGYTNGGPGEILQAPDSESVFGLLESLFELYRITREEEYLSLSCDTAYLCASWVISDNFEFPKEREFGKLSMYSRGAVWASVQNKHGAPGICTHSGIALYSLYRATKDIRFGYLGRDIARALPQYVPRADRNITAADGRVVPYGWVNERVNTCDWEGKDRVGEIFYGNCWSAVSCLLTYAEIPGIHLCIDSQTLLVADHVNATLGEGNEETFELHIENPTAYDSHISVLAEDFEEMALPLPYDPLLNAKWYDIPAKESITLLVHKEKGLR